MKIKLSKSQWEGIGKKAGWMKKQAGTIKDLDELAQYVMQAQGYLQEAKNRASRGETPQSQKWTSDLNNIEQYIGQFLNEIRQHPAIQQQEHQQQQNVSQQAKKPF